MTPGTPGTPFCVFRWSFQLPQGPLEPLPKPRSEKHKAVKEFTSLLHFPSIPLACRLLLRSRTFNVSYQSAGKEAPFSNMLFSQWH